MGRIKSRVSIVCLLAAIACFLWLLPTVARAEGEDPVVDHGIPVIYIHIDESEVTIEDMNTDPEHNTTCTGTMDIVVPDGFRFSDMPDAELESVSGLAMTIRGRGNSTWKYDKKPYKIKLDKKADLLGMGTNKHWVLLANAVDETQMKDRFTAWLGEQMGFAFTPQCVPVDVVMNGTYLGSYNLAEHVRVGTNRVEMNELKEGDTDPEVITGGYLIQFGDQTAEGYGGNFRTDRGVNLTNHTPNFEPADGGYENEAQKTYIRSYIRKFEDALYGKDFKGEDGTSYRDLMDMKSAADYWLIQQISLNGDAYNTGSTYFYKEQDEEGSLGKIYWGPLWDFDIAWGMVFQDSEEGLDAEGFMIEGVWLPAMLYDPAFRQEVKREWQVLREKLLEASEDGGLLDGYYEEIVASQAADQEVWNLEDEHTFRENIDGLKKWIRLRTAWFDAHIGDLDTEICRITWQDEGQEDNYTYVAKEGYIYYRTPEKEGYVFLGWQRPDGSLFKKGDEDQTATEDQVYKAKYIEKSKATKADEILFQRKEFWGNLSDQYSRVEYSVFPEDAQDQSVIWTSSDESVVRVSSDGVVEMLGKGAAIITAELPTGTKKSVKFAVVDGNQPEPVSVSFNTKTLQLKPGEHAGLTVSILPRLASVGSAYLEIDDPSVAELTPGGALIARQEGVTKVRVYVFSTSGETQVTAECTVRVIGGWKKSKGGWWYSLGGGDYYRNTWKKIDGKWYYFHDSGYMAYSEFVRGWWIGKNGVQKDPVRCSWHKAKRGWWYGVKDGWYAAGRSYVIDGVKYSFDKAGYLRE